MATFVLDSNYFIQAHRATYPLDVAKGFWTKTKQLAHQGTIISIDKVRKELYDKNDELESWCKENLPKGFFKDTTGVLEEYASVAKWSESMGHHYQQKAIKEFLGADEADAFLVAYSLADPKARIVVTQEVRAPKKIGKIKIPDCCYAMNVRYLTIIGMFREIGETF